MRKKLEQEETSVEKKPKPQSIEDVITHESAQVKTVDKNSKSSREREIGGIKFRRVRESYDQLTTKQLDIPKELLNNELQYRWVNEENIAKYQDGFDYSIITEEHFGKNKISLRRRVGTKKDGSDRYVVLMATPKEWKDERDAARAERDKIAVSAAAEGKHLEGGALGTKGNSEYVKKFEIKTT